MRSNRARYQQGSIKKVKRAKGYAWEVRFSQKLNGKRHQRCQTFDGAEYPTEKDVRKAIELTVSQVNAGTAGERADAKFGAITALYRKEHLPELEYATQQVNGYLLSKYIEDQFGHTPIRDMKPLVISTWIKGLKGEKGKDLAATTKASIRSILSVCFTLAALHEFIPPMQSNPMSLIKIGRASCRER